MTTGRGTGLRSDRVYTGTQGQAREAERHDARTSSQMPILRRAVVTEVFFDPIAQLDEETIERIEQDVKNPDVVSRISRGCILARTITGEADRLDSKARVFFPLFGPYMRMPIKPGEQVYVMYEDPIMSAETGLWMCRIPEPIDVDDVNYTHGDRRYVETPVERDTIDKLDAGTDPNANVPGFPNGNPTIDSLTIGGIEEYENIIQRSVAMKQFVAEPVPRFNDRPGDWSAQGSNNTLITLTTDRIGAALNDAEVVGGAGAVYIVSGRGQNERTSPTTVKNTRDQSEVDKTPQLRAGEDNPREGDLDFENDLSTLMVAMKTAVDKNFGIDIPNGGERTPGDKPAIALKTDQLRLVGREDVKIQAGDNESGAAIVLKASGDILLIPGPTGVIKLGGDDAAHALLGNTGANTGGSVVGTPILSTMGGVVGTPSTSDPHGAYAKKVLFKA